MPDALIGYTGFVGGALRRRRSFDALYNSRNIEEIRGREFDLLVCAGAPAEKWKANLAPADDVAAIERLWSALALARANHVVLLSTVDVYHTPNGVDESTVIDAAQVSPYGRHRFLLEDRVRDHFSATVIRLPALFGHGLKKNALYDLLHRNQVEKIDPDSVFQFYNVDRLHDDIMQLRTAGVPLINLVTEPTRMGTIAEAVFGVELPPVGRPAVRYDVHTQYAAHFGRTDWYIEDAATVTSQIADFVRAERGGAP